MKTLKTSLIYFCICFYIETYLLLQVFYLPGWARDFPNKLFADLTAEMFLKRKKTIVFYSKERYNNFGLTKIDFKDLIIARMDNLKFRL